MSSPRPDLSTEADVKILVDSFYAKVNTDDLLSPIFNDVARVNWPEHLPQLYKFWNTLLFQAGTYQGRPWPKHAFLPINTTHFERWLALFKTTVDEHFSGTKAAEAKNIAGSIADAFQNRLRMARQ